MSLGNIMVSSFYVLLQSFMRKPMPPPSPGAVVCSGGCWRRALGNDQNRFLPYCSLPVLASQRGGCVLRNESTRANGEIRR